MYVPPPAPQPYPLLTASAGKRVGRRFGLGERPVGHEPDKADYIAYTGEKSRLLLNPRIARAAVKRGGILSRLVDSLVEERDILDGPSVSAEECLFSATLFSDDKEIYFIDDDITDEESSVLVGLCQIRPQGYGGGQGEPVPDSIGDSPISPDTPTRPILGTEEVIEVARGE